MASLREVGDLNRTSRLHDTFDWAWDTPLDVDELQLPSGDVNLADLLESVTNSVQDQGSDQASAIATVCGTGYPNERVRCVEGLVQDTC